MKTLLAALLLVPQVALAAISWTVTKPSDCTAAGAPSGCCTVANPGANPACYIRGAGSGPFSVRADVRSDGGTYTAGGDPVTAQSLGLASIEFADCTMSNGMDVVPLPQVGGKTILLKLFSASGTEATGAVATTVWAQCNFFGR